MAHANPSGGAGDGAPPTNNALIVIAAVLLAIPVVALCWVSSYSRETPRLGGVPFFFWYQFMWVFITAALTYTAHRLVLAARKPGPDTTGQPGRIGRGDLDDGAGEGRRVEREDER
jgi:membrane protein implicated in regulation of membrane protease activity